MNFSPAVREKSKNSYKIIYEDGEILPTQESVFEIIRGIKDPEHNYTLEALGVVSVDGIRINHPVTEEENTEKEEKWKIISIEIIPTIPHCSMVGLIGLSILYKLSRIISSKYIVKVHIKKGTHTLDEEMTRQLADNERTFSAFVNPGIQPILQSLIEGVEE